jgi:hypothetical protein
VLANFGRVPGCLGWVSWKKTPAPKIPNSGAGEGFRGKEEKTMLNEKVRGRGDGSQPHEKITTYLEYIMPKGSGSVRGESDAR